VNFLNNNFVIAAVVIGRIFSFFPDFIRLRLQYFLIYAGLSLATYIQLPLTFRPGSETRMQHLWKMYIAELNSNDRQASQISQETPQKYPSFCKINQSTSDCIRNLVSRMSMPRMLFTYPNVFLVLVEPYNVMRLTEFYRHDISSFEGTNMPAIIR